MTTTSEQEYRTACFETSEEARDSAGESLGLDGSVREVRVLDRFGMIIETLERGIK